MTRKVLVGRGAFSNTFTIKEDSSIVAKTYVQTSEAYSQAFLPFPISSPAFVREYALLSALRRVPFLSLVSPCVRFYGAMDRTSLLMERGACLFEASTIRALLRGNLSSPQKLTQILQELADSAWSVLHVIHAMGIAHMDIKPANMVLERSRNGKGKDKGKTKGAHVISRPLRVMLIDWNSSTAASVPRDENARNVPASVWVTPPEALTHHSIIKDADRRKMDTWSMGISLLSILCSIHEIRLKRMRQPQVFRSTFTEPVSKGVSREEKDAIMLERLKSEGLCGGGSKSVFYWFRSAFGSVPEEYRPFLSRIDEVLKPSDERAEPADVLIDDELRDRVVESTPDAQAMVERLFSEFPPSPAIENETLQLIAHRHPKVKKACWIADKLVLKMGGGSSRVIGKSHMCATLCLSITVSMRKIVKDSIIATLCNVRPEELVFQKFKARCGRIIEKLAAHASFAESLLILDHVTSVVFPPSSSSISSCDSGSGSLSTKAGPYYSPRQACFDLTRRRSVADILRDSLLPRTCGPGGICSEIVNTSSPMTTRPVVADISSTTIKPKADDETNIMANAFLKQPLIRKSIEQQIFRRIDDFVDNGADEISCCCFIDGPPGVGKRTAVSIACDYARSVALRRVTTARSGLEMTAAPLIVQVRATKGVMGGGVSFSECFHAFVDLNMELLTFLESTAGNDESPFEEIRTLANHFIQSPEEDSMCDLILGAARSPRCKLLLFVRGYDVASSLGSSRLHRLVCGVGEEGDACRRSVLLFASPDRPWNEGSVPDRIRASQSPTTSLPPPPALLGGIISIPPIDDAEAAEIVRLLLDPANRNAHIIDHRLRSLHTDPALLSRVNRANGGSIDMLNLWLSFERDSDFEEEIRSHQRAGFERVMRSLSAKSSGEVMSMMLRFFFSPSSIFPPTAAKHNRQLVTAAACEGRKAILHKLVQEGLWDTYSHGPPNTHAHRELYAQTCVLDLQSTFDIHKLVDITARADSPSDREIALRVAFNSELRRALHICTPEGLVDLQEVWDLHEKESDAREELVRFAQQFDPEKAYVLIMPPSFPTAHAIGYWDDCVYAIRLSADFEATSCLIAAPGSGSRSSVPHAFDACTDLLHAEGQTIYEFVCATFPALRLPPMPRKATRSSALAFPHHKLKFVILNAAASDIRQALPRNSKPDDTLWTSSVLRLMVPRTICDMLQQPLSRKRVRPLSGENTDEETEDKKEEGMI